VRDSQIKQKLSNFASEATPRLGDGFAGAVLEAARRMQRAAVVHRRFLLGATAIAISVALVIGLFFSEEGELVPPVSREFGQSDFVIPE
jgi:hypothetical protein